jgi:uncharacterized membrane protein
LRLTHLTQLVALDATEPGVEEAGGGGGGGGFPAMLLGLEPREVKEAGGGGGGGGFPAMLLGLDPREVKEALRANDAAVAAAVEAAHGRWVGAPPCELQGPFSNPC